MILIVNLIKINRIPTLLVFLGPLKGVSSCLDRGEGRRNKLLFP